MVSIWADPLQIKSIQPGNFPLLQPYITGINPI